MKTEGCLAGTSAAKGSSCWPGPAHVRKITIMKELKMENQWICSTTGRWVAVPKGLKAMGCDHHTLSTSAQAVSQSGTHELLAP